MYGKFSHDSKRQPDSLLSDFQFFFLIHFSVKIYRKYKHKNTDFVFLIQYLKITISQLLVNNRELL